MVSGPTNVRLAVMQIDSPRGDSTPGDTPEEIARDIASITQIESVPTLLEVLCETTGMGFAAVARVTANTWTACLVKDDIQFGLAPGGQLDVNTTLCLESMKSRTPIVIDHASAHAEYCHHHTVQLYKIESYVSVPIVLANGRYFGNLCAIDPAPAKVSAPRVLSMFIRFAALIALALDNQIKRERDQNALRDERAARELSEQFIAILGHDLRNPLQAVYVTGQLMERKLIDPDLKGMATRINTNVKRMSSLIDDVLDFARGRLGGGMGLKITDAENIDADLRAVVKEFQDAQPDRHILADIDIHRPVHCDVGRVQQVASNLIGNALTHGALGSPVKIKAFADGDELILEVWNQGAPIPPAAIPNIFEPFWRHSTAANRQGLGLGLYICRQIVRAHGGALSATSTQNDGTQFTARLPLGIR